MYSLITFSVSWNKCGYFDYLLQAFEDEWGLWLSEAMEILSEGFLTFILRGYKRYELHSIIKK
jgi:hypothetical protein